MGPYVSIGGVFVRRPEEFSDLPDQHQEAVLRKKVVDFFTNNKIVTEEMVNEELSDEIGLDPELTRSIIYSILGSFLAGGKWVSNPNTPIDNNQLERGVQVEMRHTTDPLLAERIARDNLSVIPDYYTRITEMENRALSKEG